MISALIPPQTGRGAAETDLAAAPPLQVSVLGGAGFTLAGRELGLRNRKARAILAYLALSETGVEPRERLAGLFWSEFSEQNARATLRQAVHELREAMLAAGCHCLISTRSSVGLAANSFRVDLHDLFAAVAARETHASLLEQPRLAETLLAGFEDLDPSFHGWLTARRQTLHDRLIRGLEDGYQDEALPRRRRRRLAEAALLLDPTHEEACRVVMRTAAEDGEINVALHAYDELYRLLGDEYDMEPSATTVALVADVKQGKFDVVPAAEQDEEALRHQVRQALVPPREVLVDVPGLAPPAKPGVAIAAFIMNGVDPDQAHLVDGFRLDLIACLVRFRDWYVGGNESDPRDERARAPLSARYRLTTTAYQAGSTINTVMVLQEQSSELAIWSERFELRLENWFETQQRVVRRIAATLNVQLSIERLMRLANVPDVSLESYDVWLRAQSLLRNFSPDNWNRAVTMLGEAIERTPNFSPLYSSLVQMNNSVHIAHPGVFRSREKEERTLALAQRAVQLDPRDSQAELCLGWSLAMNKRYSMARVHMDIACELNPYDAWTSLSSALFQAFTGQIMKAREMAARAMELTLSPDLRHWTYLATICFLCGDDEDMLEAVDHAQTLTPTLIGWRAAALWHLRRAAEAKAEGARFLAAIRQNWFGEAAPTDDMIGRWILHIHPMGHAPVWERLRAGMAGAGIPDGGMTHHGW
jgi:DNA-binding SARP family transcriptional activator/TolB-like protein